MHRLSGISLSLCFPGKWYIFPGSLVLLRSTEVLLPCQRSCIPQWCSLKPLRDFRIRYLDLPVSLSVSALTGLGRSPGHWDLGRFFERSVLWFSWFSNVYGYFVCTCVCAPQEHLVPKEVRRGHEISQNWSCRWLQATLCLRSCPRKTKALNPPSPLSSPAFGFL